MNRAAGPRADTQTDKQVPPQFLAKFSKLPKRSKNSAISFPYHRLVTKELYEYSLLFPSLALPFIRTYIMPIECFANCCCLPCVLPCFTGAEGSCCCAFAPPDCCLFHPCLPCITCLLWHNDESSRASSSSWLRNSKYLPLDLQLEESEDENVRLVGGTAAQQQRSLLLLQQQQAADEEEARPKMDP